MPPKRKLTRPRSRRRYATFRAKAVRKLAETVQVTPCALCGSPKRSHHICPTCGGYGSVAAPAAAKPATKPSKPAANKAKASKPAKDAAPADSAKEEPSA